MSNMSAPPPQTEIIPQLATYRLEPAGWRHVSLYKHVGTSHGGQGEREREKRELGGWKEGGCMAKLEHVVVYMHGV